MRKFLEYKILVAILAVSVSGTGNIVFAANTGITSSTEAIGNTSSYYKVVVFMDPLQGLYAILF